MKLNLNYKRLCLICSFLLFSSPFYYAHAGEDCKDQAGGVKQCKGFQLFKQYKEGNKGDDLSVGIAKMGNDYAVVQVHKANGGGTNLYAHIGTYSGGDKIQWQPKDFKIVDSGALAFRSVHLPDVDLIYFNDDVLLLALTYSLQDTFNSNENPTITSMHLELYAVNLTNNTVKLVHDEEMVDSIPARKEWRQAVAMSNNNEIVHIASRSPTIFPSEGRLFYSLGTVVQLASGKFTIHWDIKGERYDGGTADFVGVSINDRGDVMEVHGSKMNYNLYTNIGIIKDSEIEWQNLHGEYNVGTEYTKGRRPNVDIDNDRRVMTVHRGASKDDMWMTAGNLIMQDGKLIFKVKADDQKIKSKSGKRSGIRFLDRDDIQGYFIMMRSNGGSSRQAHLYYAVGKVDNDL